MYIEPFDILTNLAKLYLLSLNKTKKWIIFFQLLFSWNRLVFSLFSIHKRDTPITEVVNADGYKELQELIEEKFPFLDEDGVARVYKNVIDLVNHQSVRILKKKKKKQIESICFVFLQRGEVLYHHVVSTAENRFMTRKN